MLGIAVLCSLHLMLLLRPKSNETFFLLSEMIYATILFHIHASEPFFVVFLTVTVLCTRMKAGNSTLNPYAEAYIPLSKRGAADGNKRVEPSGNETRGAKEDSISVGLHHWDPTAQVPRGYNAHGADALYAAENSKLKAHAVQVSQNSSSFNPSEYEKAIFDVEHDLDLAYLQTLFPGISDESLSDVYFANKGDVEATVDMLNHLEVSVWILEMLSKQICSS